jgi:hypothetical protein
MVGTAEKGTCLYALKVLAHLIRQPERMILLRLLSHHAHGADVSAFSVHIRIGGRINLRHLVGTHQLSDPRVAPAEQVHCHRLALVPTPQLVLGSPEEALPMVVATRMCSSVMTSLRIAGGPQGIADRW